MSSQVRQNTLAKWRQHSLLCRAHNL